MQQHLKSFRRPAFAIAGAFLICLAQASPVVAQVPTDTTLAPTVDNSQTATTPGVGADVKDLPRITLRGEEGSTADDGTAGSSSGEPRAIAQSVPQGGEADIVPIDLTPVKIPGRGGGQFGQFENFRASALYRLPGRLFFSNTMENSLRFESNIFQTNRNQKQDGIWRLLPNTTIGWAFTKKLRASVNHFYLQDQYFDKSGLLTRYINSVGPQVNYDVPLGARGNLTLGMFWRHLFISTRNQNGVYFNDILPSAVFSRRFGQGGIGYFSTVGQIRYRDPLSFYQEFDQFYSLGGLWRKGKWTLWGDTTLVTNFGNKRLRGVIDNQVIILTLQAARRLHSVIPVSAFVRCEPIFNIGAKDAVGFSGVNVRIFGGFITEINKAPIFPIKLKHN